MVAVVGALPRFGPLPYAYVCLARLLWRAACQRRRAAMGQLLAHFSCLPVRPSLPPSLHHVPSPVPHLRPLTRCHANVDRRRRRRRRRRHPIGQWALLENDLAAAPLH